MVLYHGIKVMETENRRGQTFLVLVPHRDARGELRKNCDSMIKAGLTDVYSFPYIAPLASLSRALNSEELRQIAHSLRKNLGSGKIQAEEWDAAAVFPRCEKNLALIGPKLNIYIPQNVFSQAEKKINALLSPPVIGCFLIKDDKELSSLLEIPREKLEFRAAAIANMLWRPLQANGEIYYKWKIGKLYWLPRPQKRFTKNGNV